MFHFALIIFISWRSIEILKNIKFLHFFWQYNTFYQTIPQHTHLSAARKFWQAWFSKFPIFSSIVDVSDSIIPINSNYIARSSCFALESASIPHKAIQHLDKRYAWIVCNVNNISLKRLRLVVDKNHWYYNRLIVNVDKIQLRTIKNLYKRTVNWILEKIIWITKFPNCLLAI